MSDLAAANCGGCNESGCGYGNNSILWLIILCSICNNGNGSRFGFGGGCGGNDSCLLIILLLLCCNNGCGSNFF